MTLRTVTAHIAAGQAVSAPVTISGKIVKIGVPATWTVAAAQLSFRTSIDNGATYRDMMDGASGNAISVPVVLPVVATVPQAVAIGVKPEFLGYLDTVEIQSGAPGATVSQAQAVDIVLTIES